MLSGRIGAGENDERGVRAAPGIRRRRFLHVAGGVALLVGGLAVDGDRTRADEHKVGTLKGIQVLINPNGHGPHEVEGWVDDHSGHRANGWKQDWARQPVGPDQSAKFDTHESDAALLFYPGGGAEPFLLRFQNPTFGRPDVTVGIGMIAHPRGPNFITRYLSDHALSEGDVVSVLNNLFQIKRQDDNNRVYRKVFALTIGG
jgi:hypothetical protein